MKTMWITLLILSLLGSFQVNAQIPPSTECGEYEFQGTLRKVGSEYRLVMFEGSMSEVQFTLSPDLNEVAGIYPDTAVTIKGKLLAPIKNQRGSIETLKTAQELKDLQAKTYSERLSRDDVRERVPDPLHPEVDSSLKLMKKLACAGAETKPKAKKK